MLKIRHNAHFSLKYLEMLKTRLHSTRAKRKRCYDVRLSRQEGSTRRHLGSAQYYGPAVKISSNTQRTSKDKARSLKCRHFCLLFDNHNFCPSCREANKGDDPFVTLESPCVICSGFSEEQML